MFKNFFEYDSNFNTRQKNSTVQQDIRLKDLEHNYAVQHQSKRIFWKQFIICMAFLSFILPSLALASPSFSGFNASVGVGVEMPNISTKGELKNFVPGVEDITFSISRKSTTNQINGDVRLGYNRIFNGCYLIGLAGDATFGHNHLKFGTRVVEINSDLMIATNANITLSNQFALLLKLGKLVDNRTLFYGLVGPRWGNFSLGFDAGFHQNIGVFLNTELDSSNKYYKEGVLVGIGSEYLLTQCISLALEYTYTYYGHPKLPSTQAPITQDGTIIPDAVFIQSSSLIARTNNVTLRLSYYY
ncbi:MAG: outer membrane beta-barrel protein [Chlamydiales bacterium]|nr:outer membrane beta-barrel protein [Chlamydiia bacterium]MCP5506979.1 outer membrane beta-barrel protein [Chlamydiales bacterium]